SGLTPTVDLKSGNIDIGNLSAVNIGSGNEALVGSVLPGLPGGFSNGVYNVGNGNQGLAGGVLSNVIQIGNDNFTPVKVEYPDIRAGSYVTIPTPNKAVGLGAENLVIGNNNEANALGNIVLANTFGNNNKNDVAGTPGKLGAFTPNLDMSNVIG